LSLRAPQTEDGIRQSLKSAGRYLIAAGIAYAIAAAIELGQGTLCPRQHSLE
jgi:hypothetical protein